MTIPEYRKPLVQDPLFLVSGPEPSPEMKARMKKVFDDIKARLQINVEVPRGDQK